MRRDYEMFSLMIFLFLMMPCYSQNETKIWYFGDYAGLNFSTNPPTVLSNSSMSTLNGCSSIADANGSLLFYTDGVTVWNKFHTIMANGTGLLGSYYSAQSALIVKQPGNSNIYYVFTQYSANGLNYSVVDMNLAAGVGSITIKNAFVKSQTTNALAATSHCNGVDVWILCHGKGNNNFYAHLLTASGLDTATIISSVGPINGGMGFENMKISPTGKKIGLSVYNGYPDHRVELYDFNFMTGVVSNHIHLADAGAAYGCEFSPDGTKLYADLNLIENNAIIQWDLCTNSSQALLASQTVVAASYSFVSALQLAPDGKIYVARFGQDTLAVINNPNLPGTACNYVDAGICVSPGISRAGLPNFVSSVFKSSANMINTFSTLTTTCMAVSFISPTIICGSIGSPDSLRWFFGDPQSGSANTSTVTNPNHYYSTTGAFNVNKILYYPCRTDTIKQSINVIQSSIMTSTFTVIDVLCNGESTGSATVTIGGGLAGYYYQWSTGQTNNVANGLNAGVKTVTITDSNGCMYIATVIINEPTLMTVTVTATPSTICLGNSSSLIASAFGGSGNITYLWSLGSSGATANVTPSQSAIYTVIASDENSCNAYATVVLNVDQCLGLHYHETFDSNFKVYPNPTNGVITVVSGYELAELEMYNSLNQKVLGGEIKQQQILNVSELTAGVYLIKIINNNQTVRLRLVKQ